MCYQALVVDCVVTNHSPHVNESHNTNEETHTCIMSPPMHEMEGILQGQQACAAAYPVKAAPLLTALAWCLSPRASVAASALQATQQMAMLGSKVWAA